MQPFLSRRSFLQTMACAGALGAASGPAFAARKGRFFERIGKDVGVQIYTLGIPATDDPRPAFTELAKIGYRDIELPGLYGPSPIELKIAAEDVGLRFTGMHMPLEPTPWNPKGATLAAPPQAVADLLGALGIRDVVVPLMPLPPLPPNDDPVKRLQALPDVLRAAGPDFWRRLADRLNEKAEALAVHGLTLGYHNHNFEFAPVGSTTGFEVLTSALDPALVKLELDLGWVATAGHDPVRELKRLKGRVRWVHVKDVAKEAPVSYGLNTISTPVGEGRLDWPRILATAADVGVQRYYVEQEPPFDIPRIRALERSYRFLSRVEA